MSTLSNQPDTNKSNIPISNSENESSTPMLTHPLTLIVATTPIAATTTSTTAAVAAAATSASTTLKTRLGIGYAGTLPWPRIKSDMSFFARVTSRIPKTDDGNNKDGKKSVANAIIMGRKTYYSLPKSLRPLGKRINVVLTREGAGGAVEGEVMKELKAQREKKEKARKEKGLEGEEDVTDAVVAGELEDAVKRLTSPERDIGVGKIYVIGGAEIYASTLRLGSEGLGKGVRVVMTKILRRRDGEGAGEVPDTVEGFVPVNGWECDTFFPVDDFSEGSGWREASSAEVSEWVGEEVSPDWKEEEEVATKIVGYERVGNVSN
ncbi:dihydrofolate reductase [Arachnomyces sp. PD_36]|nr:dihydrofolate reductase [Arachnomyces sp. PD_36]